MPSMRMITRPRIRVKPRTKGKLVHVIRHGESQHNVCEKLLRHYDTRLTRRGCCQAKALRHILPKLKLQVAVTSDVLRALQTTRAMGFQGPIVVRPDAREKSGWPCNGPVDSRRAVCGDLAKHFGAYDWSTVLHKKKATSVSKHVSEDKPEVEEDGRVSCSKAVLEGNPKYETKAKIESRARKLTRYLENRAEDRIALVSHGEFLEYLTGDDYMSNCELRTYKLLNGKWRRVRRHACKL